MESIKTKQNKIKHKPTPTYGEQTSGCQRGGWGGW